jgi:2-dehydro-3-deoxygalactonokinase
MSSDDSIIAGDWGSSRLRLWLLRGGIVEASTEAPGLFTSPDRPAVALGKAIASLAGAGAAREIVLCGMAGAREGLREVPYVAVPAGGEAWREGACVDRFEGRRLTILPGLSSMHDRPDVMRGEETQLFGLLAREPGLGRSRLLAILPGTHSKWAVLDGGAVASFVTFVTGELLARLRGSSMATTDGELDEAGFAQGLERARAGTLERALFEARSARLLCGKSGDWSLGYLSGLLIGREIASGLQQIPGSDIVIVGQPELAARYASALSAFGVDSRTCDGDTCVLAGMECALADAE